MSEQSDSSVVYLDAVRQGRARPSAEQVRLEKLYFKAFERLTHLRDVVSRLQDETDHLHSSVKRLAAEKQPRE